MKLFKTRTDFGLPFKINIVKYLSLIVFSKRYRFFFIFFGFFIEKIKKAILIIKINQKK